MKKKIKPVHPTILAVLNGEDSREKGRKKTQTKRSISMRFIALCAKSVIR